MVMHQDGLVVYICTCALTGTGGSQCWKGVCAVGGVIGVRTDAVVTSLVRCAVWHERIQRQWVIFRSFVGEPLPNWKKKPVVIAVLRQRCHRQPNAAKSAAF
jgi:hypothetical protein